MQIADRDYYLASDGRVVTEPPGGGILLAREGQRLSDEAREMIAKAVQPAENKALKNKATK
jgi:hypothetical protein